MHHIDPDRENWAAFKAMPRNRPMHLLNMIRYRDQAAYPAGHPLAVAGRSGEQAFSEYFRQVVPLIEALGGGLAWNAGFEGVITGPARFEWDRVFVMAFPDAAAFMALVADPHYKAEVVIHRTAAVLDSRLVRYDPMAATPPSNGLLP